MEQQVFCLKVKTDFIYLLFSEEQEYLTAEINEYLTSMSARREDGQYQCLVCARTSRDLYNQRQVNIC
jgi:hypothetical protein